MHITGMFSFDIGDITSHDGMDGAYSYMILVRKEICDDGMLLKHGNNSLMLSRWCIVIIIPTHEHICCASFYH